MRYVNAALDGARNLACMAPYEARFITHGGRVFGTERFEAPSDEDAIAHAARVFVASAIGKGYQIWNKDRLIHTVLFR